MDTARPGLHGHSRFLPLPTRSADATHNERKWLVEEAAFVIFGAVPWRSFYEHGAWHVAFIRTREHSVWFVEAFGDVDVAVFKAVNATGLDTFEGVGLERMK